MDGSTMLAIAAVVGAILGAGGIASIVVALITRQRPRAERAEVLVDQAQEERGRAERRGWILTQLTHEQDAFQLVCVAHILGGLGPPPPELPQRITELKQMLIDLDREGKP